MNAKYRLVLAVEWEPKDIGHCFAAVEFPAGVWTVRGLYPDQKSYIAAVNAAGVIVDNYPLLHGNVLLRTRTYYVEEGDARAALSKMREYGVCFDTKATIKAQQPHFRQACDGRRYPMPYRAQPTFNSTSDYTFLGNQCANFAVRVIEASGVETYPYVGYVYPELLWTWIGPAGEFDCRKLRKTLP